MAKGASSQTIDELAVTIGLDLDQLRLDFDTAGMTVRQAMSRLNSENTQVKLKADTASFKAAGDAIEQEKIRMQSLTQQIDIQTQKLKLLGAARDSALKSHGEDSGITRGAETAYLRQERYVAQLNAELKKLHASGGQANGLFDRMRAGAAGATGSISSLTGAYSTLSGKLAALMGVAMTGAGLFNITDKAMQAGENLYQLSNRLHLTTAEAASLSRLFNISGVSIQGIIPYFSQLDKSVMESGNGMNATNMALLQFGINLKDSSGNLLPLNQQLDQLAQGYQRAAEAGKLEEFQAQVLGRRGAELIPLLANYSDNLQIANSIKTTGLLNPQEAHQLSIEWRTMKAEGGQLAGAFGSAMMPIAKELMPEITEGMKELVSEIRDNKDGIKDAIEGWATALATLGKIAGTVAASLGELMHALGEGNETDKYDKMLAAHVDDYWKNKGTWVNHAAVAGATLSGATGAATGAMLGSVVPLFGTATGALAGGVIGAFGGYEAWGGREARHYRDSELEKHKNDLRAWENEYHFNQAAQGNEEYTTMDKKFANALNSKLDTSAWEKYADVLGDKKTTIMDAMNDISGAQDKVSSSLQKATQADDKNKKAAEANAEAQRKAAEAMKWRSSAAGRLSEKIYALTHNDIENTTHAMYVEAEKAKANGVSDDLINQFVNAQSGKIAEDKFRHVTAPMAEAFKTDLQNQLDQIDIQAKDYIKAGATQEEAQAWADQRKSQINADWDREVAAQIDSIWEDNLTKRLNEIEREKQAWIKKGLEEIKATRWAEEQKRQAIADSAKEALTTQRKYLEIYRKAMAGQVSGFNGGGVQAFDFDSSMAQRMEIAKRAIMQEMAKAAGIKPDDFIDMQTLMGFNKTIDFSQKHFMDSHIVPIGYGQDMPFVINGTDAYVARPNNNGWEIPTQYEPRFQPQQPEQQTQQQSAIVPTMLEGGNSTPVLVRLAELPTTQIPSGTTGQPVINVNMSLNDTVVTNDTVETLTEQTASKISDRLAPILQQSGISNTY